LTTILCNQWGFYYTVTTNLNKVKDRLRLYPESTEEDRADVSKKIQQLVAILEAAPKSAAWKLRARVGPRSKWYRDVEDVNR
jgi:hypothetical protein